MLLSELLPFFSTMCGLWSPADISDPVVLAHLFALASTVGSAILRPPQASISEYTDDLALVSKIVADLIRHQAHITAASLTIRRNHRKVRMCPPIHPRKYSQRTYANPFISSEKERACMRSKDWYCRATVTPARSPWRAHVACVPRLRQRQSFSRCCHSSQKQIVFSTPMSHVQRR